MSKFAQTVHHNHHGVKPLCTRQTQDKIHGHFSPSMIRDRQRVEQTSKGEGLIFILWANLAVSHKLFDILTHSSPIESGSNPLAGAKEPRMTPRSFAVELIKQNGNLGGSSRQNNLVLVKETTLVQSKPRKNSPSLLYALNNLLQGCILLHLRFNGMPQVGLGH